jgi:DNA-binding beta-propeller fold protein YncE
VEMVDTDASSPTFNQVILAISAGLGLNGSAGLTAYGGTATPDGKYVYVNYYYQSDRTLNFIGIFDVVHGTVISISTNSLGVAPFQSEMTVTPDGQSLLMTPISMNFLSSTAPIAVFDISTNPLRPTLVTTLYGTSPTQKGFYFISWKVVGNRLFALDGNSGIVVAFNFDRHNLNFSQLGVYTVGHPQNLGYYIGVSPDGALIYVPIAGYDMISVLDANKLINGHSPLITNIGAFRSPYQVTVSPAAMYSGQ